LTLSVREGAHPETPTGQMAATTAGEQGLLHALKSREERGGLGCLRSGGEDRLLVGLQDGKPGGEILRVIHARLVGDAKIGAEESGSEFGDKLLDRVSLVAEAFAELPIAAALGARPVRLMPISA
jgi:hypothetical protein